LSSGENPPCHRLVIPATSNKSPRQDQSRLPGSQTHKQQQI
jgi:hypothetical protein